MFAERLSTVAQPDVSLRRTRVQARQIYAFCEIGRLGWAGDWISPVRSAVDHLVTAGLRADGFPIHNFTHEGEPKDTRADLYDVAFCLFALSHAARALERPDLLDVADRMLAALQSWRHPSGGFYEGEIAAGPRRQNPHMHILEAAVSLWDMSGSASWRSLAMEMAELCETRFIDRESGALTEFFDDSWMPAAGDAGRLVEPGHCFEWAWLFEALGTRGRTGLRASDSLTSFGRTHGIDASRCVAINEILVNGQAVDASARLWPQTERLKIALARWRRTSDRLELTEACSAYDCLQSFWQPPLSGVWRDRMTIDGSWLEEPAPASSFYHIVCALSELWSSVVDL